MECEAGPAIADRLTSSSASHTPYHIEDRVEDAAVLGMSLRDLRRLSPEDVAEATQDAAAIVTGADGAGHRQWARLRSRRQAWPLPRDPVRCSKGPATRHFMVQPR